MPITDTRGTIERIPWGCPFCGHPEAFYRTTIDGSVMVITAYCEACAGESSEAVWEEDEIIRRAEQTGSVHTWAV